MELHKDHSLLFDKLSCILKLMSSIWTPLIPQTNTATLLSDFWRVRSRDWSKWFQFKYQLRQDCNKLPVYGRKTIGEIVISCYWYVCLHALPVYNAICIITETYIRYMFIIVNKVQDDAHSQFISITKWRLECLLTLRSWQFCARNCACLPNVSHRVYWTFRQI